MARIYIIPPLDLPGVFLMPVRTFYREPIYIGSMTRGTNCKLVEYKNTYKRENLPIHSHSFSWRTLQLFQDGCKHTELLVSLAEMFYYISMASKYHYKTTVG